MGTCSWLWDVRGIDLETKRKRDPWQCRRVQDFPPKAPVDPTLHHGEKFGEALPVPTPWLQDLAARPRVPLQIADCAPKATPGPRNFALFGACKTSDVKERGRHARSGQSMWKHKHPQRKVGTKHAAQADTRLSQCVFFWGRRIRRSLVSAEAHVPRPVRTLQRRHTRGVGRSKSIGSPLRSGANSVATRPCDLTG